MPGAAGVAIEDSMSAPTTLRIRLLGRLDVRLGSAPIRLGGRHAQALIALLALCPRTRLRDALAAELWPDTGGSSAGSLRQALWLIRSTFSAAGADPEAWIEADPDTIGLRSEALVELDVRRFERLALSDEPADLEAALPLYTGDLLESLGHECFAAERERLSDLYEDVLAAVAQDRLERGDTVGARRAAAELLVRDPLREEGHTVLIAAYGRAGTRSQVVRQYRRVCTILRSELAVEPLPETDAAYRAALSIAAARSGARVAETRRERAPFAPRLVSSA
jgi:DNA-binding SARP family transcriptional activator